jgi:hypothetical protein
LAQEAKGLMIGFAGISTGGSALVVRLAAVPPLLPVLGAARGADKIAIACGDRNVCGTTW